MLDNALIGEINVKGLGKTSVQARFSAFEALDFNFAVKVLLSLGAILITFASVSGERFSGTLKLASASGVSKKNLILAKVSASFICLAIPLVLCAIISCVVLAIYGMLDNLEAVARVGLFVLFSLIYLLFFLLVGLIISISTGRPQASLVTGVLFWLLFVFIIPALTPQVSSLFADLPSARAMEEARAQRIVGVIQEAETATVRSNSWWRPPQDANDADWEVARNQLANYAKVKRRIDMFSPADAYNNASMDIVGNGAENAFHAKRAVLQYKNNILKDRQNSKFSFHRLSFASDLVPALISMFVLCLELSVLLVIAYRKFMQLDLREG
jgi:ABC-type transport system involved in multi-copper enzyme maturation permease subunit